ncbi:immunoglobulin lambda-1 light chain-like [Thamnophis elegans]|uniref:immunoglobulin lambda-1 light chain-like n=1 Tax=Thamnophis elegans TaxID=35005 RepID=UPI0013775435|nr:immunoglobulin lambda-1 light chain-like [Thamnophis elegans]
MGWAVIFLALLTYCRGIDGQSTWTQPPSSSVSPGGTVTLSCTTTQSSYSIGWYQQKAAEGPHFVHCDGCSRGEGIPDRFTATRSGGTGSLTITNAEAEDEAVYYCSSLNSAGALAQFTMTQPASESVSPGGKVRITCTRTGGSISGYYVSWYQQKPGSKPLAVIYKDSERSSGIPERFSGFYDSSSNSASLTISNIQPEDEADYYCLTSGESSQSTVIALDGEL